MSTAMIEVAAIEGSAPIRAKPLPTTACTSLDSSGTEAMMSAVGTKMGPMECRPSSNSLPSSLSESRIEATAPAAAQAMTTVMTAMPMTSMNSPVLTPIDIYPLSDYIPASHSQRGQDDWTVAQGNERDGHG